MVDLLIRLGGVQAVLFAGMLFGRRVYTLANRFLGALVLLVGLLSLFYTFDSVSFYTRYPFFIRLEWGVLLLVGPLLWFYAQYLLNPSFIFRPVQLWHFLPYLVNISILMPFFLSPAEDKIQVIDYFSTFPSLGTDGYRYYFLVLTIATAISGIIYTLKVLKQIKTFREELENEFADKKGKELTWLYLLCGSLLVLFFAYLLLNIFTQVSSSPDFRYDAYFYIGVFVLIYGITYKALLQPEIFEVKSVSEDISNKLEPSEQKELTQKLRGLMEKERLYLENELTASQVASSLGISRQKLSILLNHHLNTRFYDFVNRYRVEDFKEKLHQEKYREFSLLGIAFEAGFNSKSAFYNAFKKAEGTTPSKYRKSLK